MGDKKLNVIGPGTLNQVIRDANEKLIQKENIVEFVVIPQGVVLVYYS